MPDFRKKGAKNTLFSETEIAEREEDLRRPGFPSQPRHSGELLGRFSGKKLSRAHRLNGSVSVG
jgi:hypothetical protein